MPLAGSFIEEGFLFHKKELDSNGNLLYFYIVYKSEESV